jgi:DNA-binding MarR family transcriptional regulator
MELGDYSIHIRDDVKDFGTLSRMADETVNQPPGPVPLPRAALGRLRVALDETFAQASREAGLSAQQAELLCAAMMRQCSIGDLARALHCDRSNVSRLVDRAAARGLVYRRGGQPDKRVTVIELTPDGERLAGRFIETLESKLGPLLESWSAERQQAAAETLSAIAEVLERATSQEAAPERAPAAPPAGAWVVGGR